jgi:hypothetical protein
MRYIFLHFNVCFHLLYTLFHEVDFFLNLQKKSKKKNEKVLDK